MGDSRWRAVSEEKKGIKNFCFSHIRFEGSKRRSMQATENASVDLWGRLGEKARDELGGLPIKREEKDWASAKERIQQKEQKGFSSQQERRVKCPGLWGKKVLKKETRIWWHQMLMTGCFWNLQMFYFLPRTCPSHLVDPNSNSLCSPNSLLCSLYCIQWCYRNLKWTERRLEEQLSPGHTTAFSFRLRVRSSAWSKRGHGKVEQELPL